MQRRSGRIPGFRPVFAADDFLVQLRAAEAGIGAIILSSFRSRFEGDGVDTEKATIVTIWP
jgi:hypothetical protein